MWPCSCRNFRPGGRWTMKHPKKDRKGPRQHDLKDDFEPFWTCIFSASDCNSAIEALTESDFMVVECACRQMAQKAGNFSCHKRYLNFGTSTFNLKTQQLYILRRIRSILALLRHLSWRFSARKASPVMRRSQHAVWLLRWMARLDLAVKTSYTTPQHGVHMSHSSLVSVYHAIDISSYFQYVACCRQ